MNDGPSIALLALLTFLLGLMVGAAFKLADAASDCDTLHAFKVGDAVYDCRKRGADDR